MPVFFIVSLIILKHIKTDKNICLAKKIKIVFLLMITYLIFALH